MARTILSSISTPTTECPARAKSRADLKDIDYVITADSGESVYDFYDAGNNEVLRALGDVEILPEFYRHNETVAVYHVGPVEP